MNWLTQKNVLLIIVAIIVVNVECEFVLCDVLLYVFKQAEAYRHALSSYQSIIITRSCARAGHAGRAERRCELAGLRILFPVDRFLFFPLVNLDLIE